MFVSARLASNAHVLLAWGSVSGVAWANAFVVPAMARMHRHWDRYVMPGRLIRERDGRILSSWAPPLLLFGVFFVCVVPPAPWEEV